MEVMKVNAIKKLKVKVDVNNGGNMDLGTNGSLVMSLSQKTRQIKHELW